MSIKHVVVLLVVFAQFACTSQDEAYINTITKLRVEKYQDFLKPDISPLTALDRTDFSGLNYFGVDPAFKFAAQFEENSFKTKASIQSSKNKGRNYLYAGDLVFKRGNKAYRLKSYLQTDTSKTLFIPFTDSTTSHQTYYSGRFLDIHLDSLPLEIDFNKAYNPYCAYNKAYDCPIPPRENHLDFAVLAGEQIFKAHTAKGAYSPIHTIEKACDSIGLVEVITLDSSIQIDLRYNGTNNFLNTDLYQGFSKAYLHPKTAQKLIKAQKTLKAKHPNYSLIIFDAVRPLATQQKMWDSLDMPIAERRKYVSDPKKTSLHNYGAAVDLSIIDMQSGELLDMGTAYDFFGKKAYPIYEDALLQKGVLTKGQVQNRRLLRDVMQGSGFTSIKTEWWHFNTFSKKYAREHLRVLP